VPPPEEEEELVSPQPTLKQQIKPIAIPPVAILFSIAAPFRIVIFASRSRHEMQAISGWMVEPVADCRRQQRFVESSRRLNKQPADSAGPVNWPPTPPITAWVRRFGRVQSGRSTKFHKKLQLG
jgi:hypothetical protein